MGFYWGRDDVKWPVEVRGKQLCTECGPVTFPDGTPTGFGEWNGRFPKRSADGMLLDQHGHLWSQSQVDAGLPPSYRIVGVVGQLDGQSPALSQNV